MFCLCVSMTPIKEIANGCVSSAFSTFNDCKMQSLKMTSVISILLAIILYFIQVDRVVKYEVM